VWIGCAGRARGQQRQCSARRQSRSLSRGGRQALSGQSPRTSSVHCCIVSQNQGRELTVLSLPKSSCQLKWYKNVRDGRAWSMSMQCRSKSRRESSAFRHASSDACSLRTQTRTHDLWLCLPSPSISFQLRPGRRQKRASSASLLDCDNQ
jgi:hypothetical protein